MGWNASDTRPLNFEDCKVPEENLLGPRGNGFKQFLKVLDIGRIGREAEVAHERQRDLHTGLGDEKVVDAEAACAGRQAPASEEHTEHQPRRARLVRGRVGMRTDAPEARCVAEHHAAVKRVPQHRARAQSVEPGADDETSRGHVRGAPADQHLRVVGNASADPGVDGEARSADLGEGLSAQARQGGRDGRSDRCRDE